MNASNNSKAVSVLFVCLGNICRSPLAEAALRDVAEREGVDVVVDSAGTGDWHIGHPPDRRAQDVALLLGGLDISSLKARQVSREDFDRFDHIIAMDAANLANLRALMPSSATATLSLLLDYLPDSEGKSVVDPYYRDAAEFEACWHQVQAATAGFMKTLD